VPPEPSRVSFAGDLIAARTPRRHRNDRIRPEHPRTPGGPYPWPRRSVLPSPVHQLIGERATTVGFDGGGLHPGLVPQLRAAGLQCGPAQGPPLRSRQLPIVHTITRFGQRIPLAWSDEVVPLDGADRGSGPVEECRRITVYDRDRPALQILTSDRLTPAGSLL